jgi:hypothetical protein
MILIRIALKADADIGSFISATRGIQHPVLRQVQKMSDPHGDRPSKHGEPAIAWVDPWRCLSIIADRMLRRVRN